MAGIDFGAPTLKVYYVCVALLALKMMMMSILTARLRFKKRIVITPEDKKALKNSQVSYNNPEIERVRRAHRNDCENIILFVSTGFLYTLTNPNTAVAILLYLLYTVARFAHTYVYAIKVTPQPARFIAFAVGYAIHFYMAGSIIHFIGFV